MQHRTNLNRTRRRLRGPALAAAVGGILGSLLSGCTAVPDWADATEIVARDVEGPQRIQPQELKPGYPNLASVPDAPREHLSDSERRDWRERLRTDRSFGESEHRSQSATAAAALDEGRTPAADPEADAVIFFPEGGSVLSAADRQVLSALAERQRREGGNLRIVAYGSASGAADGLAETMAEERIRRIRQVLVAAGVPEARIEAETGEGPGAASAESDTRRVDVYLRG